MATFRLISVPAHKIIDKLHFTTSPKIAFVTQLLGCLRLYGDFGWIRVCQQNAELLQIHLCLYLLLDLINAGAFQCEVQSDGRVLIKGETITGEKQILRYSQTFVMQTQNLCPSGPFSVSFQLPGPVDPQRFSGEFGSDAILEGIVMKQNTSTRLIKSGSKP